MTKMIATLVMASMIFACESKMIVTNTSKALPNQPTLTPVPTIVEEDFSESTIQNIVLEDFFMQREKGVIFLSDRTAAQDSGQAQAHLKSATEDPKVGLQLSTLQSFVDANLKSVDLITKICTPPHCLLKNNAEAIEIFANDVKRLEASKTYPGLEAFVSISRVGFNLEKTQALMYRTRYSGPKSGIGEYVILMRTSDQWIIKKRLPVWLS